MMKVCKSKSPKPFAESGLFLIEILFFQAFPAHPYQRFVGSLVQVPVSFALTNIPDGLGPVF